MNGIIELFEAVPHIFAALVIILAVLLPPLQWLLWQTICLTGLVGQQAILAGVLFLVLFAGVTLCYHWQVIRYVPKFFAVQIWEKPWIIAKFCLMFIIVAGFVSYNFGNWTFGISLAIVITFLSIAYWRIFDAVSDAFLDVKKGDDIDEKTRKTTGTILKRIFYASVDYALAGLSILLVVALKNSGYSYIIAVAAMWFIIDLPSATIFVTIYEKTGRDMTLGRSYRRMANKILSHSKLAGIIVFMYETTLASFWSGPDYTVLFFRDEIKTRVGLTVSVIVITAAHAFLWTAVYWFGHENVKELTEYLLGF